MRFFEISIIVTIEIMLVTMRNCYGVVYPDCRITKLSLNSVNLNDYFTFSKMIGEGGYGEVWSVQSIERKNCKYAVKIYEIATKSSNGFENEVRILRKVSGNSLFPTFYKSIRQRTRRTIRGYIFMELIEGYDLYEMMFKHGCRYECIPYLALQVGQAIQYLHSMNIAYLDLKPENIMIDTKNNQVKLVDFGFSRQLVNIEDPISGISGTVSFLAPEMSDHKNYNYQVDWYAYGIVIFELCSGMLRKNEPFHTISDSDIMTLGDIAEVILACRCDVKTRVKSFEELAAMPFFTKAAIIASNQEKFQLQNDSMHTLHVKSTARVVKRKAASSEF